MHLAFLSLNQPFPENPISVNALLYKFVAEEIKKKTHVPNTTHNNAIRDPTLYKKREPGGFHHGAQTRHNTKQQQSSLIREKKNVTSPHQSLQPRDRVPQRRRLQWRPQLRMLQQRHRICYTLSQSFARTTTTQIRNSNSYTYP